MISLYINNTPGNGKTINATGSQVTVNLNPGIVLDDKKKYQMRLLNANVVYCMPNITAKNNTLSYTLDGTAHVITFDTGLYDLASINETISLYTLQIGNGESDSLITFVADDATSKLYINFAISGVIVDCTPTTSIMPMLGFPTGQLTSTTNVLWFKSTNQAMLNSLQAILVKCDIANGSYLNSNSSNVIASITPNVSVGSTIIHAPVHPPRISLNTNRMDSLTFTLVNQDGLDIDVGSNGGTQAPELFSMCVTIEDVQMAGLL